MPQNFLNLQTGRGSTKPAHGLLGTRVLAGLLRGDNK